MANLNGQILLNALKTLGRPCTFDEIVIHIADRAGVPPHDVRESIQETLNVGVRFGFIQRGKRKYSTTHLPDHVIGVMEEVNKQNDEPEAESEKKGTEKKDNNQTDGLKEKSKRRKGGKKKRAAASRRAALRRYRG